MWGRFFSESEQERIMSTCWASTVRAAGIVVILRALAACITLGADQWRDATVRLSDGTTIEGKVTIPQGTLKIYNQAQQRYYNVPLSDMKEFRTVVEEQYMDKKWFFREDGRDEKVYTGELYPVRKFRMKVTFHDGHAIEGHIIGRTLFVESGGERRRLALVRKMEGKVGEALEDLIYVESVTFGGEGGGVMGTIRGSVELPEGERLVTMKAISRQGDFCLEGKLSAAGGFAFTDCTAGTYDLIAVTDRAIYAYFSRERDPECSRLDAGVLAEIQNWAKELTDVFELQEPVYGAGNTERAYVLVRQERRGRLAWSDPEKWAWVKFLRRYEVWLMEKPQQEWQIVRRFYLTRELSPDPSDPREKIVILPDLAGHVVDAAHPDLTLSLKLMATDESPIPPVKANPNDDGDKALAQ